MDGVRATDSDKLKSNPFCVAEDLKTKLNINNI